MGGNTTKIAVPAGVVQITQKALEKILRHTSGARPKTLDSELFGFRVNGKGVLVLQPELSGPLSGIIVYTLSKIERRYEGRAPTTYRIPNTVEEVVALASQDTRYWRD